MKSTPAEHATLHVTRFFFPFKLMLFFLICTRQSQITVFWEVGRAQATSAFIVMTSCNTLPCDQEIINQ
jgi:hypothetical protein